MNRKTFWFGGSVLMALFVLGLGYWKKYRKENFNFLPKSPDVQKNEEKNDSSKSLPPTEKKSSLKPELSGKKLPKTSLLPVQKKKIILKRADLMEAMLHKAQRTISPEIVSFQDLMNLKEQTLEELYQSSEKDLKIYAYIDRKTKELNIKKTGFYKKLFQQYQGDLEKKAFKMYVESFLRKKLESKIQEMEKQIHKKLVKIQVVQIQHIKPARSAELADQIVKTCRSLASERASVQDYLRKYYKDTVNPLYAYTEFQIIEFSPEKIYQKGDLKIKRFPHSSRCDVIHVLDVQPISPEKAKPMLEQVIEEMIQDQYQKFLQKAIEVYQYGFE